MSCFHLTTALRIKRSAVGVAIYRRQCVDCGLPRSHVLKHSDVDASGATPWDAELERRTYKQFQEEAAKSGHATELERRQRDQEWAAFYAEHMQSAAWRATCVKVHKRDRGLCQGCLEQPGRHVHHLTYERLGAELLIDLVLLCRRCHGRVHPHMLAAE